MFGDMTNKEIAVEVIGGIIGGAGLIASVWFFLVIMGA